jgi:hypothetical protein
MIKEFKFFSSNEKITMRFSSHCCYDNAKYILESLISTNEWETTVFPKEYPHTQGTWRVLYVQQRENNYHSVVCWVPRNPGYITERFLVNIDL